MSGAYALDSSLTYFAEKSEQYAKNKKAMILCQFIKARNKQILHNEPAGPITCYISAPHRVSSRLN
jgi:hypothetical protein